MKKNLPFSASEVIPEPCNIRPQIHFPGKKKPFTRRQPRIPEIHGSFRKKIPFLIFYFLLVALVLLTQNVRSQFNIGPLDGSITIAPSNFLGDLNGNLGKGGPFLKDNNISMTKVFVGVNLALNVNDWMALRLSLNYGHVAGDDAIIKRQGGYEEARKGRNLSFKSKIKEAFFATELYPSVFFEEDPGEVFHKIRPYGLVGLGVFKFNPMGTDPLTNKWVNLKPLRTEGQGFTEYPDRAEYKLTQFHIPLGAGIKYFISDHSSVSFEVIHRKTFTDYIDDVHDTYIDPALFHKYLPAEQAKSAERMAVKSIGVESTAPLSKRGNPRNYDGYYSFGLKFSFRLSAGVRAYKGSTGCYDLRN